MIVICAVYGKELWGGPIVQAASIAAARAGHLRYFFRFFTIEKSDIFCIFNRVNLTGSGLFN